MAIPFGNQAWQLETPYKRTVFLWDNPPINGGFSNVWLLEGNPKSPTTWFINPSSTVLSPIKLRKAGDVRQLSYHKPTKKSIKSSLLVQAPTMSLCSDVGLIDRFNPLFCWMNLNFQPGNGGVVRVPGGCAQHARWGSQQFGKLGWKNMWDVNFDRI